MTLYREEPWRSPLHRTQMRQYLIDESRRIDRGRGHGLGDNIAPRTAKQELGAIRTSNIASRTLGVIFVSNCRWAALRR